MQYKYLNKVTGAVITAPCKIINADYELMIEEKKAEEQPKPKKKTATKKSEQ